ncbi:hypothetical protein ED733_003308 [Metarhizium rileyi]|uniref:Acetate kinase n=1 Tax=Metarhizium rileyi (strain RCEF 4871) TaxID=1649241 RepID=A0A5C6GBY5_METRR|nr:hypothetical protein ED733_003308 [Metarhizium rileyi]
MAAASSSSGSSFASSSLGRPPAHSRSYVSPVDSTWTPTSEVSTLSVPSIGGSAAPQTSLRPLDLGPPGYQATITLFQDTPDEHTVYLGPWEVVGSEQRRVLWQCSYQNELLEHYLPSDIPSEIHPHTLHSRHRQYHDPSDMERYLMFPEPHRIRYISDEGLCLHDQYVQVRYEFTTVDGSTRFQGDLRRKDLIGFYDVDVVWTNVHGRTDAYGKVKGIGAIQRLKMWRDRYTTFHSLSVLANKTDGQYREYDVRMFDGELRNRDDRAKQLRLSVRGQRGSASNEPPQRRFSFARGVRPRARSTEGHISQSSSDSSPSSQSSIDIRHLSIQFSSRQDYRRFIDMWLCAHSTDRDFRGVPFPPDHFELPSPQMLPGQAVELESPDWTRTFASVAEPEDSDERG